MLNILFFTRKWPPAIGGMETYSFQLTNELAAISDLDLHKLPGQFNGRPPTILSLTYFMMKSMYFLIRNKKRYDVVHIGDLLLWPLALFAKIFQPSTNVVITAYGLDIVYGSRKGLIPKIYKIYLAFGVKLIAKKVKIIAISNATSDLCRSIGFNNVQVVTLGVSKPVKNIILETNEKPYVLFVGRLVKRKGAGWFIDNVMPLVDEKIKMIVVGKFWDTSEQNAISNNSRVDYRGLVSNQELSKLRRGSVAVLMPNIPTDGHDIEGFGLTALEAAADGGVLLASAIEGIVDAVIDGVTGFLLPSKDKYVWAHKINELQNWSTHERMSFVRRARITIEKKYSWKRVAEDTLKVYQNFVQNKTG